MIHDDATKGVLGLGLMGVLVGVGKLLTTNEKLTWRVCLGRAIASGALGMSAAAVLVFVPTLSFAGQLGVAAMLASLGTSALEALFARITGGTSNG